jgi:hypothetical protein
MFMSVDIETGWDGETCAEPWELGRILPLRSLSLSLSFFTFPLAGLESENVSEERDDKGAEGSSLCHGGLHLTLAVTLRLGLLDTDRDTHNDSTRELFVSDGGARDFHRSERAYRESLVQLLNRVQLDVSDSKH